MIFGDSFQGNFCKLHQKTFKNSKNTVFETRWLGALHKKLQKTEKKTVYFLVKLLVLELIVVVLSGQKKVSFFDYFGIYESKLSFNLGKYMFFCPKNTIIWQFLLAKHFFHFLKNATWEVNRSLWCEKNIKNVFFEKKWQFSRLFWHLQWTAAFQKDEKCVFSAILARILRSENHQKGYPPFR